MLKLYQREQCPFCRKVRQEIENQGLSVEAVYVDKLASERRELLALPGAQNAEVPVLVDGKEVIQGSDAIVDHLRKHHSQRTFGDPTYGLTRVLKNMSFSDAITSVKTALQSEGFGVLTEIDVQATFKKKLDVDFKNYVILGACNPPLAHQGLQAEPALGLLLPCNVVVTEEASGNAVVSAVDPVVQFKVVNRPELEEVAKEVRGKLERALAAIA